MSKCFRVLVITQNFGFGPTSMLNRALNLLPENCLIFGYIPEHLEPVIDPHLGVKVIGSYMLDESVSVGEYDVAIVACDYEIARRLHRSIKKIIILDMLFWFWPTIDEIIYRDVLVIAQNFWGVEKRAKGIQSVQVVGPIVPDILNIKNAKIHSRKALVNLGGFTSPYNHKEQATCYVDIILPMLRIIIDSFDPVDVVGGKTVLSAFESLDEKLLVEFDLVSNGRAIAKISEASCYITAPGLGSIYESFLSRTPTFFLPPTNLTQHLQLSRIIEYLGYPWKPNFDFDYLISDEENYITSLYEFYDSKSQMLSLGLVQSIEMFISSSERKKTSVANTGFEFAKKMGGASEDQVKSLISRYNYA